MTSLKDEAKQYEPPRTLNVADLERIPVDLELKQGEGEANGEKFKYKYITIEDKDYRVPGSVLGGIQAILEKKPNLEFVSVIKQGQGMNTRYQVIPSE